MNLERLRSSDLLASRCKAFNQNKWRKLNPDYLPRGFHSYLFMGVGCGGKGRKLNELVWLCVLYMCVSECGVCVHVRHRTSCPCSELWTSNESRVNMELQESQVDFPTDPCITSSFGLFSWAIW